MPKLSQKLSVLSVPKDTKASNVPPSKGIFTNKIAWVITALLAVTTAVLVYLVVDMKLHPNKESEAQARRIVSQVGKLVVLPDGEEPTVATVINPEQLAGQPFFAQARKGYKVLIYTLSQKAILYDPERNKVVEIAPVNLNGLESSLQPQPQQVAPEDQNGQ